MKLNLLLISAAAFATLSLTAKAQIIVETGDEPLFNTAVTGQTVDDFEGLGVTPGNSGYLTYVTYTDGIGSFYDGVSDAPFTPPATQATGVYIVESDSMGNPVGKGDGSVFMVNNSNGAVTFTADSGYSAVGANLFAVATTSNSIVFTVTAASIATPSDTLSQNFTLTLPAATAAPSNYFAGFVAPLGYEITGFSYPIVSGGNGPGIDNFRAGTVNYSINIPEPASIGLVMIGLLSLAGWMRFRVRSQNS